MFFETPDEAENRAAKRKNLEELGVRKRKRHSPNPDDLEFDKDGLLKEVKGMKDGDKVSISLTIITIVTQEIIIILIIRIMIIILYILLLINIHNNN